MTDTTGLVTYDGKLPSKRRLYSLMTAGFILFIGGFGLGSLGPVAYLYYEANDRLEDPSILTAFFKWQFEHVAISMPIFMLGALLGFALGGYSAHLLEKYKRVLQGRVVTRHAPEFGSRGGYLFYLTIEGNNRYNQLLTQKRSVSFAEWETAVPGQLIQLAN